MSGTPYYSEPLDMDGFRHLRVEASVLDTDARPTPSVDLHLEATNDFDLERKMWSMKGQAINLVPGVHEVRDYMEPGRLARVRIDVHGDIPPTRFWIRLTRLK